MNNTSVTSSVLCETNEEWLNQFTDCAMYPSLTKEVQAFFDAEHTLQHIYYNNIETMLDDFSFFKKMLANEEHILDQLKLPYPAQHTSAQSYIQHLKGLGLYEYYVGLEDMYRNRVVFSGKIIFEKIAVSLGYSDDIIKNNMPTSYSRFKSLFYLNDWSKRNETVTNWIEKNHSKSNNMFYHNIQLK